MFEYFFKIEKRWGESRRDQICGAVLFVAVLGFMVGNILGYW